MCWIRPLPLRSPPGVLDACFTVAAVIGAQLQRKFEDGANGLNAQSLLLTAESAGDLSLFEITDAEMLGGVSVF